MTTTENRCVVLYLLILCTKTEQSNLGPEKDGRKTVHFFKTPLN
jgi:hypothetical protein